MKKYYISTLFLALFNFVWAQNHDTLSNVYQNKADQMLSDNGKLNIGGYGEVHYNQPLKKDFKQLGQLDVHRIVMFLGYNFSSKTQFVTEIEFEYAKELWVEQAFIQHKINPYLNFKAGLILVPMGIVNEYHEPNTFNGVERPIIDNKIAPSTWREVGFGFTGTILPASLKYQVYMMGGLNGYDTKGIFSGSKGLREGRQKGSKAYINSPAYTAKVEYYGIRNLNLGISYYGGKSQSKLFHNLDRNDAQALANADSSVVNINMLGLDGRYNWKGLQLRGQLYWVNMNNTDQYNIFTRTNGVNNDLGSQMLGYYAEIGYNVFKLCTTTKTQLIPFFRYEFYNMHHAVGKVATVNESYKNTMLTTGLTFKINEGVALKSEVQFAKSALDTEWATTLNFGFGIMF